RLGVSLNKAGSKPLPLVAAPTPDPGNPAMTMRGVPAAPSLVGATATASATVTNGSPDLSSLVSTARGREGGPPPGSPAATMNGMGPGTNGTPNFATGSHKTPVPLPPTGAQQPLFESGPIARDSAPIARPSQSDVFDPMSTFGSNVARRGDKKK